LSDDIDRACEREEELRSDALRDQARRAGLLNKTVADSATECEDCGEEIPLARRRAVPGCKTCITCQQRVELGQKGKFSSW
jgi:phage/conjugal plasmid C-4 type zinc finger TraR family protein